MTELEEIRNSLQDIKQEIEKLYDELKGLGIIDDLQKLRGLIKTAESALSNYDMLSRFITLYCRVDLDYPRNMIQISFENPVTHNVIVLIRSEEIRYTELKDAVRSFIHSPTFIEEIITAFFEVMKKMTEDILLTITKLRQYIKQQEEEDSQNIDSKLKNMESLQN